MKKKLNNILFFIAVFFLVLFIIFVVNQTAGFVLIAKEINPLFGSIVLYGLLVIYAVIVISPIIIYLKMPPVLRPPENENSPEFDIYIGKVKRILAHNKYIADSGIPIETRSDIDKAIELLNTNANDLTISAASTVCISTAISQNGHLDSIMVLLAQVQLIWKIAHVYNQRPSIREIIYLYFNVAATAFIAGKIEDLDIEEQIEPIVTPLISASVVGGIPGAGGLASFMTKSIVDGAANALLTLRVGIVTRRYFGIKSHSDTNKMRRFASREAGTMLASIVVKSAGYVSEGILKASKKRAGVVGGTLKDVAKKSAGTMTHVTKKSAHTVVSYLRKKRTDESQVDEDFDDTITLD